MTNLTTYTEQFRSQGAAFNRARTLRNEGWTVTVDSTMALFTVTATK